MSRIVQEKFEVRSEERRESKEGADWVSDKSARDRHGLQTRESNGRYERYSGDGYNCLPPGTNIEDQEVFYAPAEPMAPGGMGSGTQATEDVTPRSIRTGYDRKSLRPTDDMYTREHNDAFYDTIEVEGVEGFVERNNYLDRL